jgi:serine/threonine protein kinase
MFPHCRYIENGSLQRMVKRYGIFPEPLIAAYVQQVLQGLLYLHGQGVIHRGMKRTATHPHHPERDSCVE